MSHYYLDLLVLQFSSAIKDEDLHVEVVSGDSGVEGVRLAKRPLGLYYMAAHARKTGTRDIRH